MISERKLPAIAQYPLREFPLWNAVTFLRLVPIADVFEFGTFTDIHMQIRIVNLMNQKTIKVATKIWLITILCR